MNYSITCPFCHSWNRARRGNLVHCSHCGRAIVVNHRRTYRQDAYIWLALIVPPIVIAIVAISKLFR